MKRYILFFLISILVLACTGTPHQQSNTEVSLEEPKKEIPVLDLASVISKQIPDTFTLNSIAKNARLIPISTTSQTVMGVPLKICYADDKTILIFTIKDQVFYRLDSNGKILKRFRHLGHGPGEYSFCSFSYVNPQDSTIQILDDGNQKWITYDLDGNFLKEVSLNDKTARRPIFIADNFIVSDDSANQFCITDPQFNIKQYLCPFDTTMSEWEQSAIRLQTARSRNADVMLFNHADNDTVFQITEKGAEPFLILKKGAAAMPKEKIKDFMQLGSENYLMRLGIGFTPDYYLITYVRNHVFREEVWRKSDNQIIYRSTKRDLTYKLPSGKKIHIGSSTLYLSKNQLILLINAEDVLGEIPGVKEDDNPILLVIEL